MNAAELRAIAEAATPFDFGKDEQGFVRDCDRIELQYYIATFRPARVKALLDCVDVLQKLDKPSCSIVGAELILPFGSHAEAFSASTSIRAALKALEAA